MSDFGLVHMQGRIYDPTLGRFLQADPHIQAPKNSQSHNRYAYVLNNPLSYTDPSGYFFKALGKFVKKYWKTIVAIAAAYVTFGLATGAWSFAAIGNLSAGALIGGGAAAGFVSGAISTGSLRGALQGAFSGALFGAIGGAGLGGWESFAVSGLAGGVMSDLQGGKFGHGFISAGVGAVAGGMFGKAPMNRIIGSAIVGGTLSKITGGKFANGALTAAFAAALRADYGGDNTSANRGIEGQGTKKSQVDDETAKQQTLNVEKAKNVVDKLIADNKVPVPEKDGYILDSVEYDPSIIEDASGQKLYGKHIPTDNVVNQAKIKIYAPGAATMQDAITTYGHELGHFNLNWSHSQIEQYGQAIYRVYNGEKYTGPKP